MPFCFFYSEVKLCTFFFFMNWVVIKVLNYCLCCADISDALILLIEGVYQCLTPIYVIKLNYFFQIITSVSVCVVFGICACVS